MNVLSVKGIFPDATTGDVALPTGDLAADNMWTGTNCFGGTLSWGSRMAILSPQSTPAQTAAAGYSYATGPALVLMDSEADNAEKFGVVAGAPFVNANKPWVALSWVDGGTKRRMTLGCDGYGMPVANEITVHLAADYGQATPGTHLFTLNGAGTFGMNNVATPITTSLQCGGMSGGGFYAEGGRFKWRRGNGLCDTLGFDAILVTASCTRTETSGEIILIVDATTGPVTITLPNPGNFGTQNKAKFIIKKINTNANAVTAACPQNINGVATVAVVPKLCIVSCAGKWYTI